MDVEDRIDEARGEPHPYWAALGSIQKTSQ
jgi:hypothetical protein